MTRWQTGGNKTGVAAPGLKGWDYQFWAPLEWDDSVSPPIPRPLRWLDSWSVKNPRMKQDDVDMVPDRNIIVSDRHDSVTVGGHGCHLKSGARCMLPRFAPTWDMRMSTIFMPCNDSGFHDVEEAIQYGIVSYDWSNAKQLWVNNGNGSQPMNDEELLTTQAEMVMAADQKPNRTKVWIYRNTIKALNWFSAVREKLDDPAYSSWFIRFDPGQNGNYSQPACDVNWSPPKCSPFWHDQAQSPAYPEGDGSCANPCFCGINPCGEYIFDHRNASFSKWFLDEWMISNETLLHEGINGLLLDDHMLKTGPTETHGHFLADTGLSIAEMADSVQAYNTNMETLWSTIVERGGFAWDLFQGGKFFGVKTKEPKCLSILRNICGPNNEQDAVAEFYKMSPGESLLTDGAQYTAAFLLTRGIFAWIGFEWAGCRNSHYPRPVEWDADYGTPNGNCTEVSGQNGSFVRHFSKATVTWDCSSGKGSISMLKTDDATATSADSATSAAGGTPPNALFATMAE
jgi:hypothetical protein